MIDEMVRRGAGSKRFIRVRGARDFARSTMSVQDARSASHEANAADHGMTMSAGRLETSWSTTHRRIARAPLLPHPRRRQARLSAR